MFVHFKFERERDEHLLPRMDSEEEMEEDDEEETSPEPAKPEPETFRPLEPKASPQENTVSNNNTASVSTKNNIPKHFYFNIRFKRFC